MRHRLSDFGFDFDLMYRGEFFNLFSGGIEKKSAYLGDIDFKVNFNFEKIFGWKGASAFVYVLNTHGGHPSWITGDYQAISNIEAPLAGTKVYEAWFQQLAFDSQVSFLVGLHDLNSEFYVTDAAGLFFNSTFGVGKELSQTGVNGSSVFPVASMAGRVRVEPSKNFYLQVGIFDAQSGTPGKSGNTEFRLNAKDGQLVISEFAFFLNKENPSGYYGKYGFGIWNYTRTFTDQVTGVESGNNGAYFISEQAVHSKITLFFKYGVAAGEVNRAKSSMATGVVFTGLIPSRDQDRFGLGMAKVDNSGQYMDSQIAAGTVPELSETTLEANYRFEVMSGVAVQPDIQYVIHPNTNRDLKNATVGSLRVELKF